MARGGISHPHLQVHSGTVWKDPDGERSRKDCSDRLEAILDIQWGQDLSLINHHLALALSALTCLVGSLLLRERG